ncbi:MAG TPA: hypothetical protein PLN13_01700 [Bacteroidia bacterium]|nr:hypothetical protein [Bacteroidia bacterium]HRH07269.1 hypothetical protein [Bacteroidia bacterium]
MNKKSKLTIYLAFIAFIFLINSSCKKYPDGPWISLTSKEKRLERSWKMDYLEIGGIDSTTYFMDENDSGYKFNELRFYFERDRSFIKYNSLTHPYGAFVYFDWNFSDNRKNLVIRKVYQYPPYYSFKDRVGPFWVNEKVEFRIRKLTKNELWLESTFSGNLIKAHFNDY